MIQCNDIVSTLSVAISQTAQWSCTSIYTLFLERLLRYNLQAPCYFFAALEESFWNQGSLLDFETLIMQSMRLLATAPEKLL